jgi:flavin reductase (DIM6/NTAB) family NADH-FMN oxidoreductase RutF
MKHRAARVRRAAFQIWEAGMNSICREKDIANASGITSVDALDLKRAMRTVAGGVSVITAGVPGDRTGATVTSATAFSMGPPMMIVTINRSSSTWPAIQLRGHFCVNILRHDQHEIASRFSGMDGIKGEARYDGARWTTLVSGAPVLDDAATIVDCVVDELIERHSHGIVLGRAVAIRVGQGAPLVYGDGRYGRFS